MEISRNILDRLIYNVATEDHSSMLDMIYQAIVGLPVEKLQAIYLDLVENHFQDDILD